MCSKLTVKRLWWRQWWRLRRRSRWSQQRQQSSSSGRKREIYFLEEQDLLPGSDPYTGVHHRVRVRECVRACVRESVRACARPCVRACVRFYSPAGTPRDRNGACSSVDRRRLFPLPNLGVKNVVANRPNLVAVTLLSQNFCLIIRFK